VVKLAGRHNGVDWYSVRFGTSLLNEANTSLVAADTIVSLGDLLAGGAFLTGSLSGSRDA